MPRSPEPPCPSGRSIDIKDITSLPGVEHLVGNLAIKAAQEVTDPRSLLNTYLTTDLTTDSTTDSITDLIIEMIAPSISH